MRLPRRRGRGMRGKARTIPNNPPTFPTKSPTFLKKPPAFVKKAPSFPTSPSTFPKSPPIIKESSELSAAPGLRKETVRIICAETVRPFRTIPGPWRRILGPFRRILTIYADHLKAVRTLPAGSEQESPERESRTLCSRVENEISSDQSRGSNALPVRRIRGDAPMNRHNRRYMVLLIAMAFFCGLGIISMAFMSRSPTLPEQSRWMFQMTAWINAALVAGMVVQCPGRAYGGWRRSNRNEGAQYRPLDRDSVWNSLGHLWFDEGGQGGRTARGITRRSTAIRYSVLRSHHPAIT